MTRLLLNLALASVGTSLCLLGWSCVLARGLIVEVVLNRVRGLA